MNRPKKRDSRLRISEEQCNAVGQAADTLDNLLHAMRIPIRPEMHLQALWEALPSLRDELRKIYVEVAGDDPWAEQPKSDNGGSR